MTMLFSGGAVIDGDGNRLDGYAVLVAEERIERVAPLAEFEGFAGKVVDTTGQTLLPGLVDCHVHLMLGGEGDPGSAADKMTPSALVMRALRFAQTSLKAGVTGLRDCGGRDHLEFGVRDACNRGEQLGPTIRAAGRMICMTGGHGNRYGRVADGVDDVVKAVREQVHAGCDLIKIMATGGVMTPGVNPEDAHYSPEEIAAGIKEGHRFHKHSASHAQGTAGILNAVRGGVDSIEHGIFMDDACIEEMIAAGTTLVPTLAAVDNIVRMKDHGIPPHAVEKAVRCHIAHKASVKAFYEAGGKIAMGTDAGTPYNKHGENPRELSLMADLGMDPMDIITFSTRNGHQLMRNEARGLVKQGYFADLLLVDGDPLADIQKVADTANHRMVVKNGIVVH
ncbi:MAG: amidohydrolase family protein [Alphaproteobacteria bacterium]|nr:amidohydrolase family protein [Alphaproteobacteria bacterium]